MTFKSFFSSKTSKVRSCKVGDKGVEDSRKTATPDTAVALYLFGPEQEKMHRSVIVVLMAVTAQGFSPRIAPSAGPRAGLGKLRGGCCAPSCTQMSGRLDPYATGPVSRRFGNQPTVEELLQRTC